MAGFNIKVTSVKGVEKLEKKLRDLSDSGVLYSKDAVLSSALMVHETAIKLIQTRSPGKKQTRYNPKREVTAANPGEAPNTDTGRLVQSIKFNIIKNGTEAQVGTNLKYGAALEFGTKNMEPRPWLSTALKLNAKKIEDLFRAAIRKAVKEVAK